MIKSEFLVNSKLYNWFNKLNNFNIIENKAVGVMKPGHTFTIEPMISQGKLILINFNKKTCLTN